MVKSSSILTALPNMKMYCMKFENSHIFRSRSNKLNSGAGSDDSISPLPRFLETILMRLVSFGHNFCVTPLMEKVRTGKDAFYSYF